MKYLLVSLTVLSLASLGQAGDPCLPYWVHFKGSCYRYFGDRVTWDEARERCRDHFTVKGQAELISIHNREENSFAYDLYISAAGRPSHASSEEGNFDGAWIGLYQPVDSSTDAFKWTDETESDDFESWAPNQPDNAGGKESCGQFWRRNEADDNCQIWNDASCNKALPYICKVAKNC